MAYVFPIQGELQKWIETATALYREELLRDPDPSGLATVLINFSVGGTADTERARIRQSPEWHAIHDPKPIPSAPSRDEILNGRITLQGLKVTTEQYGEMPWWPACWAWLSAADRRMAAQQLIAHGDQLALIHLPSGSPLYDEPNQFYSPDKFPAKSISNNDLIELIAETLQYGFKGIWLFLDGDDGQNGYPIALEQVQTLGSLLTNTKYGNLNDYIVYMPGWDGVWHKPNAAGTGYNPPQIANYAKVARASGAKYVGIEHGTGYILAGEGGRDYESNGVMSDYDLILGEFDDGQFDDNVWQLLGRYLGPAYVRPPEQPAADDPHPPYVLAPGTPRGPYVYRVFEYFIYGFVRGATVETVKTSTTYFQHCGAINVC